MAQFGLRVVGTDTPQIQGSAQTRQVGQADMSTANQLWDRAQETQAAANQELIRTQQARLALKQAEVQQAQIDSQRRTSPIADIFNGAAQVLGTIQEVKNIRAQQEAEMARQESERADMLAEREAQEQAAIAEAEREAFLDSSARTTTDLMASLQGQLLDVDAGIQRDIDSRGYITSYSDAINFIQTHREVLTPEDYEELVLWAGETYEGRNKNQQDHLYTETRTLQSQAAEQVMARQYPVLATLANQISTALSPSEAQRYISNADGVLQTIQQELLQANTPMPVVLSTINQAYSSLMEHVGDNAEARSQLQQSQRRYEIYAERIASVEDAFAVGNIDAVTRGRMLAPLKLGMTGELDFGMLTSPEAMQEEVRRLELYHEMADITTPEAQAVSGAMQGQILLQMNYNGGTAPPQYGEQERRRLERTYNQAVGYHDTVQGATVKVQELANERLTIQADQQNMITDIGSLQTAINEFNKGNIEEIAAFGYTSVVEAEQALDDIVTEYTDLSRELEGIDNTITTLRQEEQTARDNLTLMGLPHGLDYRAHIEYMESDEYKQQAEQAAAQLSEHRRQGQDFSLGNSFNSAPVPLATIDGVRGQNQEDWSGINAPFPKGTYTIVTSGQGQRTGRYAGSHPAVDFGVPEGTPVLAPRSGRVTRNWYDYNASRGRGGGWVVSIEHADGTESSYLHLTSQSPLQIGETVSQGQTIGAVGGTGGPNKGDTTFYGAHLDLRVKSRAGGTYDVDVSDWLQASVQETHPESGFTLPSLGVPPVQEDTWNLPSAQYQAPPEGAFMLTNGDYIFNGQYYYNEEWFQEDRQRYSPVPDVWSATPDIQSTYNTATPIQGVFASAEVGSYNTTNNNPEANYGYAFFDRNPHAARKLAQVSNNLQIPAQWLADIMYFETGGTFNPAEKEKGGSGAVGLIQFYPGGGLAQVARDMGVSESTARTRLMNMSFVEQMDWVQSYLSGFYAGDTQFVGRYDRIERLLSSIFQGQGTAFGNELVDLVNIGDGNITLGRYMQKLGTAVGRRYYTVMDKLEGMQVHDTEHADCPTCRALRASGSGITPHTAASGYGSVANIEEHITPEQQQSMAFGWLGGHSTAMEELAQQQL